MAAPKKVIVDAAKASVVSELEDVYSLEGEQRGDWRLLSNETMFLISNKNPPPSFHSLIWLVEVPPGDTETNHPTSHLQSIFESSGRFPVYDD